MATKSTSDLMSELIIASQEMLPAHLMKSYCYCGTCRFIRLREETIEVLTGTKQGGEA